MLTEALITKIKEVSLSVQGTNRFQVFYHCFYSKNIGKLQERSFNRFSDSCALWILSGMHIVNT